MIILLFTTLVSLILELINQYTIIFNIDNINFLQYISDRLKNDKEIIIEAIKKNGNALVFASNELKNDKCLSVY